MSIYHFDNPSSPIDELVIRHTDGGGTRAYLHARADANLESLTHIKKAITAHNWQWTPMADEGKPVLEVRGFGKDEKNLTSLLMAAGVTGPHHVQALPEDKGSFKDKLKSNTLKASGLAYFIGDAGFLTYGYKRSLGIQNPKAKYLDLLGGVFYAIGTPFIAFFGRGDKSDIQFRHMSYSMIHELENRGVDIPQDASVRAIAHGHNDTLIKKVKTFCYRYPAEITNGIFALAGAMIFSTSIIQRKDLNKSFAKTLQEINRKGHPAEELERIIQKSNAIHNVEKSALNMDMGLGLMTILAGLVSVGVEETPTKPGQKKGGIEGAWQWVKEKPLRTAGALLGVSTVCHAGSTYVGYRNAVKIIKDPMQSDYAKHVIKDAQNAKGALPGRALFVATNLTAEALMAVSSKGHGAGVISDKSLDKSAYAMAADLVLRTAPAKRDSILKSVVEFLAAKEHLGGDAKLIEKGVLEQLDALAQANNPNPWSGIKRMVAQEMERAEQKEIPLWQHRIAESQQSLTPAAGI